MFLLLGNKNSNLNLIQFTTYFASCLVIWFFAHEAMINYIFLMPHSQPNHLGHKK